MGGGLRKKQKENYYQYIGRAILQNLENLLQVLNKFIAQRGLVQ